MPSNQLKHMPALDGLRGVAILLVILTHAASGWVAADAAFQDVSRYQPTFTLPTTLAVIANGGLNGVQLFFIVSAFTLTVGASIRDRSLAAYALRRAARIAPAFWLATALYALTASQVDPSYFTRVSLIDLVMSAGFLGAWVDKASSAGVPGGWSIACEAAFYVALPFTLRLIDGRIWRAIVLTCVAGIAAQLRARQMIVDNTWSFLAYTHAIQQAPVFLCGITAALIAMRFRLPRLPGLAVALLGFAICLVPFAGRLFGSWWALPYLLFSGVAAAVVMLAASHPPRLLANTMMRKIGDVSYSMYLVHFALLGSSLRIAEWLVPANDQRTMLCHFVIVTILSFCVSLLTHRLIERPAMRWAARQFRAPIKVVE